MDGLEKRIRKAVLPVAGLGTRGLPFTKEVPKEMLPIIDVPAIHFIVEEVIEAGIEEVIFVTSKGKSLLEDYFDPSPRLENFLRSRGKEELADKVRKIGSMVEVISVRQKEPLGLGHAVMCARKVVGNEPFAVCLGDEIFPSWKTKNTALSQMVSVSNRVGASVAGVLEISKDETTSYGIIDIGGKILGKDAVQVKRTVEKPKPEVAPSHYAIIGRYVFEPAIFDALENVRPGSGGEIQLTDGMDKLCEAKKLFACLVEGARYDIGNQFSYLKAQLDAASLRPKLAEKLKEYLKSL